MKKQALRTVGIAAVAGLLIAAGGVYPQQSVAPVTRDESVDQLVEVGGDVMFSVTPVKGASYQWLYNGVAINGQTNSTLTIENAGISDAGFYSCNTATGADVVPTAKAYLMVYTITPDFFVVVYGTPITSSGSSGSCPGAYTGIVNYTKSPAQGWGWAPNTNTTIYTASDTTRTNTKVEYVGDYGDEGCNKTTVTIPYPAASPAYRFTIYFTNNVPSTNYPITLGGFNP